MMTDCILGAILSVCGFAVTMGAVMTGLSWTSARSWPRVQARLKRATIEKRKNVIGPTLILDQYRPAVTYEYRVGGRSYEGRRITFRDRRLWHDDRGKAEERIAHLGDEFTVAVSPRHPDKAVIEYQLGFREFDFLGVVGLTGALLAGVGVWVVWMMCPCFM